MENELKGKVLVGLGDSLMYGAHLERNEPWLALMGEKHEMEWHNHGVSGSSCATSDIVKCRPLWIRLRDEVTYPHVDYFVIQGGANDCCHNVPIGDNTDNLGDREDTVDEVPTFKGALNYMINTVKFRWPGVRLLMMTNYNRKVRVSKTGHLDEEYVYAMLELARFRGVPCIDNYHGVGIDLRTPELAGTVTDYGWAATSDNHISPAGNRFLLPIYEQALLKLNEPEDPLKGKTIIGLGDSLMYGYRLERDQPWIALLGEKHRMDWHNYGKNGRPAASAAEKGDKVIWKLLRTEITAEKHPHVDYFVLQGGANDRRFDTPPGDVTDNLSDHDDIVPAEIPTFSGAINYMINTVKSRWPGAKLLLLTNYKRRSELSPSGISDEDYVNAMLAVAKYRGVPVLDCYHDIGLDIRDPAEAGTETDFAWAEANERHLSPAAYRWLTPIFERKLLEI